MSVVNIGYIHKNHAVNGTTNIGTIILNYLIGEKSSPWANVTAIFPDGEMVSLYSYDLTDPISSLERASIILTRQLFVNDDDKFTAIEALKDYIELIENKTFEEHEMYFLLLDMLNKRKRILMRGRDYKDSDRGVVHGPGQGIYRDSMLSVNVKRTNNSNTINRSNLISNNRR